MMFNRQSITACNTPCLVLPTIGPMHESAARLYDAARVLANTEGQSNVARLLNLSPQVMKNWESRGVSFEGAISAEKVLGVSPAWIVENAGTMLRAVAGPVARLHTGEERRQWRGNQDSVGEAVDTLSDALEQASSDLRDALAANLAGWARSGGTEPWRGLVKGLLAGRAATPAPAPRVGNGH